MPRKTAKKQAANRCKVVRTPSGKRYLKAGKFVKKSRC